MALAKTLVIPCQLTDSDTLSRWVVETLLSEKIAKQLFTIGYVLVESVSRLLTLHPCKERPTQSGRPAIQMKYLRLLLIANCWQGWSCEKSNLQCLELSHRYIRPMGS